MGLSNLVANETRKQASSVLTDKFYSYDALGRRVALTDDPDGEGTGGAPRSFTYGYDAHGSVSLLLQEDGTNIGAVEATYGYDPYGGSDQGATSATRLSEGDLEEHTPLNPYRYTGKRLDTGSGTIDMGARRFGPDITRFLQRDFFSGALSDLGLSGDPLTGNRYALASRKPVSFVEWDGHVAVDSGTTSGVTKSGKVIDVEVDDTTIAPSPIEGERVLSVLCESLPTTAIWSAVFGVHSRTRLPDEMLVIFPITLPEPQGEWGLILVH